MPDSTERGDRDSATSGGRRFTRPWEEPDDAADGDSREDEGGDPTPPPPTEEDSGDEPAEPDESSFDQYSHDDYLAATTREYQGLAEEVRRAGTEEYERQAVAASMAGVGSGLIGFEDVTGRKGVTEEEVEAEEQQRTSDLTLRVGSAVVLVGLFVGSLFLGGVWFTGFVGLAALLSLGEFYATVRTRGYTPVALFGFVGLIGAIVSAHLESVVGIAGWVMAMVVGVAFFYAVVPRKLPLENAAVTVFGLAWVSMLAFAVVIGRSPQAVGLILLIVLVTATFDIGSYFVGRAIGRRPLAPQVSPKKTVEGLVGGVLAAFALSAILSTFPLFDPLDLRGALEFALLVCVLAPLGDAAESVVKRALGTKDMGSILPGHGGMLDRIDALLFVVPAAYFLFEVLEYL